jgi:hypothetical protein
MHNSLHALVVAQYTQDRIAEATSARRAREAKSDREPKLPHARRWLTRRAAAVPATPETSRTVTALPPV